MVPLSELVSSNNNSPETSFPMDNFHDIPTKRLQEFILPYTIIKLTNYNHKINFLI